MAEAQWVVFSLGPWQYAVPIHRVREIQRPVQSVRMPRVAPFVRGLFNLRGQVLPLIDTSARLGLAPAEGAEGKKRVVVVEAGGGSFGLMVDAVLEVLRCDESAPQAPRNLLDLPAARFVAAVLDLDGRLVFALDLDRLLEDIAESGTGEG
ncbi:MAG TPA: chemotaxis protein CheW [bacterium]|nr:chemotaxis protein CheW [bacterium]